MVLKTGKGVQFSLGDSLGEGPHREDFGMGGQKKRAPRRRWLGGYVSRGKRGPAYVIERVFHGEKFHISTKCRTERAALDELARFEADPFNYRPQAGASGMVMLTDELILAFREWMTTRREPAPAGREWAYNCARLLFDWMEDFGGKDLRRLSVSRDIEPALDERKTSRMHRVEALKSFCTWLRRTERLKRAEDPTLDLPVPKSTASKREKVVEPERVRAVLPHLEQEPRDVLLLQSGTALHVSEVRRFAESGELLEGEIAGYVGRLVMRHKRGTSHVVGLLFPELLDAARRIKARGRIPRNDELAKAMKAACAAAGVTQFRNGNIRNSVLTWAHALGADMQRLADFAGHRSKSTTADFYVRSATPPAALPLPRIGEQTFH
jgi:integrase